MAADQPLALDESWPLVGRDAAIERAIAGLAASARSVFAYGPSGIGKSRVVHAVAEQLADDGWLVLTASGNPALTAVPLGALAPVLAREPGSMVSAASDPVALYAAADAAVRHLAGGREVLLALDDVSVADSVSVTLISQLVQAGRIRVAATVRESDPVPDGLQQVAASADSVRLDLGPLNVDEVVDTTGAGDAFAAGFLSAWQTGDPQLALQRGAELAAQAIAQRGGRPL